ncbi:MAG: GNAT family N-acetyltransferase [Planctomycetes bacterium]|nr:GNAT family N-acetyltransferase [Planctomycetota bacterium]
MLAGFARAVAHATPPRAVFAAPLGGGMAVCDAPGSPLNKIAGLGFAPLDEQEFAAAERAFAVRDVPVQVELATHAGSDVLTALTARGYRPVAFEDVLGCALPTPLPAIAAGIATAPSPDQDLDAWIDTMILGFAQPDLQGAAAHEAFDRAAIERAMRDMQAAPGFARYEATADGRRAGAAGMRLQDGIALLCGAATLPEHRRRGVQTALLGRRLGDAAAAGCDLAVLTTLPGSKSQQNAHRRGFWLLYSRIVLVKQA